MDLFTYLMAKNDHNTSINEDLFAYLLGKANGGGEIKTVSGITITIPDAKKTNLVSFMMTKESTQIGTPTPDNPVEVNVVEGYRNLFNSNIEIGGINSQSGDPNNPLNPRKRTTDYISVEEKNYTLSSSSIDIQAYCYCYDISKTYLGYLKENWTTLPFNFTTLPNTKYIKFVFRKPDNTEIGEISNLQLIEGNQELPYVPYGNNYIAINISNETNTNKYPIPLNNNILVGKGDYKDELKVDTTGHVFINKKTGKIIFDGTTNAFNLKSSSVRNIVYLTPNIDNMKSASVNTEIVPAFCSHFINDSSSVVANLDIIAMGIRVDERINFGFGLSSNLTTLEQANQWLTTQYNNGTPVTTYYPLETPELIDLQTTVDINLFKGANTITNSEDGYMTIEYQ